MGTVLLREWPTAVGTGLLREWPTAVDTELWEWPTAVGTELSWELLIAVGMADHSGCQVIKRIANCSGYG